jgi:hygromycin-B 7''-O-kinase
MHSFPNPASIEVFHAWRADASQWLPVATDIARSHSLSCADLHVFTMGTNRVVALDQRLILKSFPPMLRHQFESERAALERLHGRLSISIPQIIFEGERSGWPYLVMPRMNGVNGKEAWPRLSEDQRESVLAQVGETIAEVQGVPVGDLSQLQPQWEQFVRGQIEGCRARHQRLGLPQKYLDGLDDLLRDAATLVPMNAAPVILTGEYKSDMLAKMRQAVLAEGFENDPGQILTRMWFPSGWDLAQVDGDLKQVLPQINAAWTALSEQRDPRKKTQPK